MTFKCLFLSGIASSLLLYWNGIPFTWIGVYWNNIRATINWHCKLVTIGLDLVVFLHNLIAKHAILTWVDLLSRRIPKPLWQTLVEGVTGGAFGIRFHPNGEYWYYQFWGKEPIPDNEHSAVYRQFQEFWRKLYISSSKDQWPGPNLSWTHHRRICVTYRLHC